jgi:hypothetical protein
MPGDRRRGVALAMLAFDRVGLRVVKCFANGAALSNRITALFGENESRGRLVRLPRQTLVKNVNRLASGPHGSAPRS